MAIGIANPADLPAKDVERLKALMLVEEYEAALRLTAVGKQRYRGLPNSAAFELRRTRRSIVKDGRVHQQGPQLAATGSGTTLCRPLSRAELRNPMRKQIDP